MLAELIKDMIFEGYTVRIDRAGRYSEWITICLGKRTDDGQTRYYSRMFNPKDTEDLETLMCEVLKYVKGELEKGN